MEFITRHALESRYNRAEALMIAAANYRSGNIAT